MTPKAQETEVKIRKSKLTTEDLHVDFLSILETQAKTLHTEEMMLEIERQLEGIPHISSEKDEYGNLYVTKGTLAKNEKYPAFVSHTDTVHNLYEDFHVIRSPRGNYTAFTEDDDEYMQVGVGGDDKCGIILCLELLHRLKKVKVAFFLDEEQGCKGSNAGNLSFFDDCRYAIQIDRKGRHDIITTGSGTQLCSEEFKELLNTIGKKYSYSATIGMSTDVVTLKNRGLGISACNLSCGYYNPHTKQEYINENDLLNCLEFCLAIAKIKTVYPHTKPVTAVTKYPTTTSYSSYQSKECIGCNKKLYFSDGRMCIECIRNNFVLVVKEGKQTLIERVQEDETDEEVSRCLGCQDELRLNSEITYGVCVNCMSCGDCGEELTSPDDIKIGFCKDHQNLCANAICSARMWNKEELNRGICDICFAFSHSTATCQGHECSEELKYEDELENGLCRECRRFYLGI